MRGANLASRFSTTHHAGPRTGQVRSQEPYARVNRILNVGDPEFASRGRSSISPLFTTVRGATNCAATPQPRSCSGNVKGVPERTTDTLHRIIRTPFVRGGYVCGISRYGERRTSSRPRHRCATAHLIAWSHPAYAQRSQFARNDTPLVCVSLAASP